MSDWDGIDEFVAVATTGSFSKGAKAVGLMKSGLAQSIYAELKPYRINQPVIPSRPPATASEVPPVRARKRPHGRRDDGAFRPPLPPP